MHLAARYKVISKLLFFASLVVGLKMVIVGVAKVPLTPCCFYAALRSCLPAPAYGGDSPASSKANDSRFFTFLS